MFLPKTRLRCQVKGCTYDILHESYDPPPTVCEKCGGELGIGDPNAKFVYDLVCVDSECSVSGTRVTMELDQDIETVQKLPCCKVCGSFLDFYWRNSNIGFRGFTTPGGNGSPKFKNLPKEIQGWAKKKYEQDRHYENEVKKPMQWPDGTKQKGIK